MKTLEAGKIGLNHIVLEFHDINPSSRLGINTLHPERFEHLIKKIREYFDIGSFHDTRERSVILTFDDGYESVFNYAFPILKLFKVQAGICVISGFLSGLNEWDPSPVSRKIKHVSQNHLLKLMESGWTVIAHGHHHIAYRYWNRHWVVNDFKQSLEWYRSFTGNQVQYFALPFNQLDYSSYRILKDNITNLPVFLGGISSRKEVLPRLPVYSFMTTDFVLRMIEKWPEVETGTKSLLQTIQWGAGLSAYWQRYIQKFPHVKHNRV